MKKILLTFFVIFSSIFINASFCFASFLDSDDDLNLYKKIDEWFYELESNMTEVAARWHDVKWKIWPQLNSYLINDCFIEDPSINDLNIIDWLEINDNLPENSSQISTLKKVLKPECFWTWLSLRNASNYMTIIKDHLKKSYKSWKSWSKDIYKISRIWLFSDWVEENSPFDLMIDINEINKVIFTEKIPYDWINNMDNDLALSSYLDWKIKDALLDSSRYPSKNNDSNWSNKTYNSWAISDPLSWLDNNSWYVCKVDESWLNQNQLNAVSPTWWTWSKLDKIQKVDVKWVFDPYSWWNFNWNKDRFSWYSSLNDNWLWPCNQFFCITISFKMYNQNLLWGWFTNSIQRLIERSNWHLKKFTNTSLVQSRMSTNNFQIWLKDLKLPDLFNVWFIVDKKAPPIMNLNWWKELNEKPSWEKISKTLIKEYFKNYWLEYDRINDLDIYNKQECEIASVINSAEEQITKSPIKNTACENLEYKEKLNEIISNNIDSAILFDDLKEFDNQFIELAWFLANFPQYSKEINIIISKMLYKPTWSK